MVKFLIFINSVVMVLNSFLGINFVPKGYQINSEQAISKITASTEKRISEGTLTGAHIIVMQNNKTLIDKTFGLDGANGKPLKNDAVYRIASMTKPITALALLIEHDRGHLSIYDDVTKYLPQFNNMYVAKKNSDGDIIYDKGVPVKGNKAKNKLKLYQLVSHTSGVGDVNIDKIGGEKATLISSCDYLSEQALYFDPGTDQMYSTGAFDIAARIVEITSGMEFKEYIKVNIFDKLGMTDTTYIPNDDQWSRMVKMHNLVGDKVCDVEMVPGCVFGNFPVTYTATGAGLASTASDYSKFAQMLLNDGKAEDGTEVISKKSLKLLSTPVNRRLNTGSETWGLGVRVVGLKGILPAGSFGWSGAYGSHFWVDPVNKVTVVYMKNSAYDGGAGNKSATELENDIMNSFTIKK